MERCRLIETQGFEVRQWWECEVEAMLKSDPKMRSFYDEIEDNSTIINLRGTFHGGRVGPMALKCDLSEIPGAQDLYTIRFFDIVSLYPSANFNCEVVFYKSYN